MNDQERECLQKQYPMWHIRRPVTMDFFIATRLGRPLTQREINYGLCATLIEDSPEELKAALSKQHEIEGKL